MNDHRPDTDTLTLALYAVAATLGAAVGAAIALLLF